MPDDIRTTAGPAGAARRDGADDFERLTIVAREAGPAALEYHRQRLSEQGYTIAGRIERHRFQLVDGPGLPTELFEGEPFYAATFVRRR